jgi:hypothetical protein
VHVSPELGHGCFCGCVIAEASNDEHQPVQVLSVGSLQGAYDAAKNLRVALLMARGTCGKQREHMVEEVLTDLLRVPQQDVLSVSSLRDGSSRIQDKG